MAPARSDRGVDRDRVGPDHRGRPLRRHGKRANRPPDGTGTRVSRAGGAIDRLDRPVESSHPVAARSLLVRDDTTGVEIAEQLVSLLTPDSFAADQYRALRHAVEALRKESGVQVIAVTSPGPGDGKTVTTLNLAG